ncbi:MAG: xanthine dehydrogenase family protein molybdopterin-binding subunit [Firmicutes bacterium]|nr:xanthine dehydrogenase family protein molybdopterin-binding subunit [Bacillota bacterium]
MTRVVGQPVIRSDAWRKVTGASYYTVDVTLPAMLVGKLLRSPYAHARIVHMDISRARQVPGVAAVVAGNGRASPWGGHIWDQPVLPADVVRYRGEPLVAVAAESEAAAEEALRLVEVVYEALPSVFDPEQAMEPGAPLLHPQMMEYWRNEAVCRPIPGTNAVNRTRFRVGSVTTGFSEAAAVVEATFTVPGIEHVTLEPTAAVAWWERDDRLTVWTSTQCPFVVRDQLAHVVGLPLHKVRVIVPDVGGGFGGKGNMRIEPYAALLSRECHRPVKMVHSRYEEFVGSTIGHPAKIRIKLGATRDGVLTAIQTTAFYDTGAYGDSGEMVSWQGGLGGAGPYRVPHVAIDSYAVYTNKVPAGAFRGMGWPQMLFAIESAIDMLSARLQIDPVEFRLKNLLENGDRFVTGEVLESVTLRECLLKAREAIDWDAPTPPNRGRGVALVMKSSVNNSTASAVVKIHEDTTVQLVIGAPEIGQGSHSAMAQIAAEILGVAYDAVEVTNPDTAFSPYDRGAISDRTTFHLGQAVYEAATQARQQLLAAAADWLEANPADLEICEGYVMVKGVPARTAPLAAVARRAYRVKGGPIIGEGRHLEEGIVPLDPLTGQSPKAVSHYKYGAQAVEVEVDRELGMVKVLRVVSVHDCGRAINPIQVSGQIEGAVVQGLGLALWEALQFEDGQVMNPSLMDYHVPMAPEIPEIVPILVECPHPHSPFGVKGIGEPGIIGVAPAVANAVSRAVGIRIFDLPLAPERVLRALQATQGRAR